MYAFFNVLPQYSTHTQPILYSSVMDFLMCFFVSFLNASVNKTQPEIFYSVLLIIQLSMFFRVLTTSHTTKASPLSLSTFISYFTWS